MKPLRPVGHTDEFEATQNAHRKDDVDVDVKSHHHTIGEGATQAASGLLLKQLQEEVALLRSLSLIPGEMKLWPTTVAPTGWFLCDGAAINRVTYADLFALIGITFGAGDGATTFNLPNLKGRVPVGRDAAQAEFDVMGEVGGAKTHVLTVAEMPNHRHSKLFVGAAEVDWTGDIATAAGANARVSGAPGTDITTGFTGGDGAHNNLQPYMVLNYIIKS